MDICHLKNAELEAKHQKYKGRVVLRGDIVKDNSGSYAVFTEQGSSASQMTAAKIMDIISSLLGCDGQAADAISAFTQVKKDDAPKLWKNTKVGMCRHLDSSTTTQMAKLLNKEVDFGEPSSFLDHVYLGCTQRKCEISKDIVDNYRTMFESRISV